MPAAEKSWEVIAAAGPATATHPRPSSSGSRELKLRRRMFQPCAPRPPGVPLAMRLGVDLHRLSPAPCSARRLETSSKDGPAALAPAAPERPPRMASRWKQRRASPAYEATPRVPAQRALGCQSVGCQRQHTKEPPTSALSEAGSGAAATAKAYKVDA
eukprot:scaffold3767_cov114-Isochrysis_galbana.AAC.9